MYPVWRGQKDKRGGSCNLDAFAMPPALLDAHFVPMDAGAANFCAHNCPPARHVYGGILRTTHIENLLSCLPHSFQPGSPFSFQFQR